MRLPQSLRSSSALVALEGHLFVPASRNRFSRFAGRSARPQWFDCLVSGQARGVLTGDKEGPHSQVIQPRFGERVNDVLH